MRGFFSGHPNGDRYRLLQAAGGRGIRMTMSVRHGRFSMLQHCREWRSPGCLLSCSLLALVGTPAVAIPANLRNSTTPSQMLVRILASPTDYYGQSVSLQNVNVQCMGSVCTISAGGQSLLLDHASLRKSDRQRLLTCVPLGCAASIRGSLSRPGAFAVAAVPVLSVEALTLAGASAQSLPAVASRAPLQAMPPGPPVCPRTARCR